MMMMMMMIMMMMMKVAAASPGDCSFEDDECGWQNPGQRDAVDEIQWERKSAEVRSSEQKKNPTIIKHH